MPGISWKLNELEREGRRADRARASRRARLSPGPSPRRPPAWRPPSHRSGRALTWRSDRHQRSDIEHAPRTTRGRDEIRALWTRGAGPGRGLPKYAADLGSASRRWRRPGRVRGQRVGLPFCTRPRMPPDPTSTTGGVSTQADYRAVKSFTARHAGPKMDYISKTPQEGIISTHRSQGDGLTRAGLFKSKAAMKRALDDNPARVRFVSVASLGPAWTGSAAEFPGRRTRSNTKLDRGWPGPGTLDRRWYGTVEVKKTANSRPS